MKLAGKNVKGTYVAIAAGGAVVAYVLWRKSKTSASNSADSSQIDPVTGLPVSQDNQIDPLTGMTYLAEAQQYGSVQAAEAQYAGGGTGTGYGGSGYGSGYPYYDNSGSGGSGNPGVSYPDNASWAQAADAGLTDLGYPATEVAAAIGRYLGRLSLTPAEATIVEVALAEYGNPPVGHYQIIIQHRRSGGGGGGKITVPNLAGISAGEAHNRLVELGLHPTAPAGQTPNMKVSHTNPKAGTKVDKGSKVEILTRGWVK